MADRLRPQWTVSGVIEADVNRTWNAILNQTEELSGEEKALLQRPAGECRVEKTVANGTTEMTIDARQRMITRQGHWWYRGVTSIEAHPDGALVSYRVYNIAPGMGWWIAQLVQERQHAQTMQTSFAQSLNTLGQGLGCRSYILP